MYNLNYFTTEKGITSTSANFVCNIAKEYLDALHQKFNNLKFYSEKLKTLNSNSITELSFGVNNLSEIEDDIAEIAIINSLVTYLRKAIKEKDKIMNNISDFVKWKYPDFKAPEKPEYYEYLIDADIMKEMSLKEIVEYSILESHAAHYGKMVHPKTPLSLARDQYNKIINNPNILKSTEHESLIVYREPSVNSIDLENSFMNLLNKQRDFEKRLNSIKFKIEEEVHKRNQELISKNKLLLEEYNMRLNEYNQLLAEKHQNERNEISKLKIIIPEEFKTTFNFLNSLGDKVGK